MAQGGKKPTKAERKDQARQHRLEEIRRRQRKARMRKMTWLAVAAVAVAGIGVLVYLGQRNAGKNKLSINKLAAAAGCDRQQDPKNLGQGHIPDGTKENYSSKPPTSGPHFNAPAQTGVHTAPIEAEREVHNLEHGHILLQYKTGGIPDSLITKLEGIEKDDPTRIVVAPYEDMPYKAALTAWGHLIGCSNPNDQIVDLARKFIKTYKGKGPEGDLPGTPLALGSPAESYLRRS